MLSQNYIAECDQISLISEEDSQLLDEVMGPIIVNPPLEELMRRFPQCFTDEFHAILNKRF